ncbi:hypothetical protein [Motiliproteus sediminis]|uniref:hypothetical protein n=1 Tax=Motiliproteus sediminis TaxID=1468178 RepID=UPI001AEF8B26|nr:hypothetical protein [Motiliproteus sediminis]
MLNRRHSRHHNLVPVTTLVVDLRRGRQVDRAEPRDAGAALQRPISLMDAPAQQRASR